MIRPRARAAARRRHPRQGQVGAAQVEELALRGKREPTDAALLRRQGRKSGGSLHLEGQPHLMPSMTTSAVLGLKLSIMW